MWLVEKEDKYFLGIPGNDTLVSTRDRFIALPHILSYDKYFDNYFSLQKFYNVTNMYRKQLSAANAGFSEDELEERIAVAGPVQQSPERGPCGDSDILMFAGQKATRLNDYRKIIRRMQSGDMLGALPFYGLGMMALK